MQPANPRGTTTGTCHRSTTVRWTRTLSWRWPKPRIAGTQPRGRAADSGVRSGHGPVQQRVSQSCSRSAVRVTLSPAHAERQVVIRQGAADAGRQIGCDGEPGRRDRVVVATTTPTAAGHLRARARPHPPQGQSELEHRGHPQPSEEWRWMDSRLGARVSPSAAGTRQPCARAAPG